MVTSAKIHDRANARLQGNSGLNSAACGGGYGERNGGGKARAMGT